MYKNFSISEEERKQILESHRNHGYGKPLKEQEDQYSNDGLELDDTVNINIDNYDLKVIVGGDEDEEVLINVTVSEEGSNYEVIENTTNVDDEKIIEFVKNKLYNDGTKKEYPGVVNNIPIGCIYDMNTKEFHSYH